jgi:hypothetical protein
MPHTMAATGRQHQRNTAYEMSEAQSMDSSRKAADTTDMPFWASPTDHSYPPHVQLAVIKPKLFQLLTPFSYEPRDGTDWVDVLAFDPTVGGSVGITDLASVPPLLWGLLPSYGRQLRAALMHDQLCNEAAAVKQTDRAKSYSMRRRADGLFQMAMRDPGDYGQVDVTKRVGWARSWIFWAGVSFGRYWGWRKIRAAVLSLQVIVGVLVTYMAVQVMPYGPFRHWLPAGLGQHWYGYLLVLGLLFLLCSAWGRDWLTPFIGLLVSPVVLPVLFVTFIASRLLSLPDWMASKFRNTEPQPDWGPALTKKQTPSIPPVVAQIAQPTRSDEPA